MKGPRTEKRAAEGLPKKANPFRVYRWVKYNLDGSLGRRRLRAGTVEPHNIALFLNFLGGGYFFAFCPESPGFLGIFLSKVRQGLFVGADRRGLAFSPATRLRSGANFRCPEGGGLLLESQIRPLTRGPLPPKSWPSVDDDNAQLPDIRRRFGGTGRSTHCCRS